MELIKKTNIAFMGKRKVMYLISAVCIIAGLTVFCIRGQRNFGVDFIGGDMIQVAFNAPVSTVELRAQIRDLNVGGVTVQSLGTEEKEFIVKSSLGTSQQIVAGLRARFGEDGVRLLKQAAVSPSMSESLRKKAWWAFFTGLLGVLIYLTVRFEFRFATTATLAIFHDLLFTIGILALAGEQIDTGVIAALLTVVGYSVNDTVVVFDRIRENIHKTRSTDYEALFNNGINETLSRTMLTGCSVIFTIICILIFGGEALHTFALTLLVGLTVGTYSSVFVASALVVDWQKISPHRIKL